jgi:agmatinase
VTEVRADRDCFLGATRVQRGASIKAYAALLGLPWDAAVTYRAGAAEGPAELRAASDSIETYCPLLKLDLVDGLYADFGDFPLPPADGPLEGAFNELARALDELTALPLLGLGGDHLAAYPFLARALHRHPDLQILHIDAHGDLRDEWEGERFNHSTVIRRVLDLMQAPAHLYQWGIRSGTREEFALAAADERITRIENTADAGLAIARRLASSGRPVYVTLDVDGIDPADLPGTGTPEPAGLPFRDVERALVELARAKSSGTSMAGADLVELAPRLDPTGRSVVAAARLVRTLLLVMRELQ